MELEQTIEGSFFVAVVGTLTSYLTLTYLLIFLNIINIIFIDYECIGNFLLGECGSDASSEAEAEALSH